MVNTQNLQRILDVVKRTIEERSRIFIMCDWFKLNDQHYSGTIADIIEHPCGTSGCIAGWATIFSLYDKDKTQQAGPALYRESCEDEGAAFLELAPDEADYLFMGRWHRDGIYAKNEDVVLKLQRIIDTGVVIERDWDIEMGLQYLPPEDAADEDGYYEDEY